MADPADLLTSSDPDDDADLHDPAEILAPLRTGPMVAPSPGRKVYVNRDLRLDRIRTIGFDMDYSLAIYRENRFEALTFRRTLERLVEEYDYPEAVLEIPYDPTDVIRGLVVDKKRGNVLKVEQYNYVGHGCHGTRALTKEDRRTLYKNRKISLRSPEFRWVDTLFEIPEVGVYARLVDFLEERRGPDEVDYARLFEDVRRCMDAAHADPRVKGQVASDPEAYLVDDPHIPILLHRFRSSGKRLFLLTNSSWSYTNRIMHHLLHGRLDPYPAWTNYFDLIICDARKPTFFTGDAPFRTPAGLEEDLEDLDDGRAADRILEGGNLRELEGRLEAQGGEILFVGDHIYGDILRSKKATSWRTAMIVPELEEEIRLLGEHRGLIRTSRREEELRRKLGEDINFHRAAVRELERQEREHDPVPPEIQRALRKGLDNLTTLRARLGETVSRCKALERELGGIFNERWGMLFREGNELSRFGEQVMTYAGIYTSRVSNLAYYSPNQYFRAPAAELPHERIPWGRGG